MANYQHFRYFSFSLFSFMLYFVPTSSCLLAVSSFFKPFYISCFHPFRVNFYSISFYYEYSKEQDYICSKPGESGMHQCVNLPPFRIGPMICNGESFSRFLPNFFCAVILVIYRQWNGHSFLTISRIDRRRSNETKC